MSATAGRSECDGYVEDLQGQLVLFTGKTRIEGEHVKRDELFQRVRQRGGRPLAGTRNRNVTLLVLGELSDDVVTDPVNLRSQNVVFGDEERRRGNHICIVDDRGVACPAERRECTVLALADDSDEHRRTESSDARASDDSSLCPRDRWRDSGA